MKKLTAFALIVIILTGTVVFAQTDDFIVSDPARMYTGVHGANEIISNARFTDVSDNHWARIPIVRDTALSLAVGYDRKFNPSGLMTNEEAITFIMRAVGLEEETAAQAAQIVAPEPQNSSLRTMWALGNLYMASQLGMITPAEYDDAITQTTAAGNPNSTFIRLAPATREDVAHWLVLAFRSVNAEAFPSYTSSIQKITNYSDYDSISASKALSAEAIMMNNIMSGYPDNSFRPKGNLTRAEMAQILYNLDAHYFNIAGLEKKTGTVAALKNSQYAQNGSTSFWRDIYVRTADGSADVLRYEINSDTSPQPKDRDAVTYKNNAVSGMSVLEENDVIEYIVRSSDNAVLYVQVKGGASVSAVTAKLYSVNPEANTIEIIDAAGKHFVYSAASGLFTAEDGVRYLMVDGKRTDITKLPYGSNISLGLNNNTAIGVSYVGEPVLSHETRGIVTENNTDFGYITIIDNSGKEVTNYYYENDITVRKQQYYESMDNISYIGYVFPDFRYNPANAPISDIEPGDIVFITYSSGAKDVITSISASTNYIAKYGRVVSSRERQRITDAGEILVEYENKQTSWFTVANGIFISAAGKPVSFDKIMTGDWVRLLVNQAVIAPGYMLESVKEIVVEGGGHYISTIVKGNFAGVNQIQKQLTLENSYVLSKTGWTDYKNISAYSLSGSDIEYYNGNERISLDYAVKFFSRSDATVYVALENSYSGERVKKVTFRSSRDEAYPSDTVTYASGNGTFSTLGIDRALADSGTIVRRYGRLVDAKDILPSDYASVVLNGNGTAAVVDIADAPDNSKIMIARGRIYSIDEGKSFKLQSMSVLSGQEWIYTPVQSEYTIDHNTMFIDANGITDSSGFIGYTGASKIDKVYYFIIDGGRATHVIEAPFAAKSVRGTIYNTGGQTLYLKDASYYDDAAGLWKPVSVTNAVIQVSLYPNSVIVKNNSIIFSSGLVIGDTVRVFTGALPSRMGSGVTVDGNIIFVDR